MPNSDTIPSGSPITEEMITLYIALYGGTRSGAIGALNLIATGAVAPTATQRTNQAFSAVISAYDQSVRGMGEGGRITSPTTENDVSIAGPAGTGKWTPLGALLATIGTIAAIVVTSLTVTSMTATNSTITNLTATNATTTNATTTLLAATTVNSPSLPSLATVQMTNGTTTACSLQNTDATGTRVISDVWLTMATGASAGAVTFVAGTSSGAWTTSTSPLIGAVLTRAATGPERITTTATVMTAYAPWAAQDWFTFMSVTTVNAGTCYIEYKK